MGGTRMSDMHTSWLCCGEIGRMPVGTVVSLEPPPLLSRSTYRARFYSLCCAAVCDGFVGCCFLSLSSAALLHVCAYGAVSETTALYRTRTHCCGILLILCWLCCRSSWCKHTSIPSRYSLYPGYTSYYEYCCSSFVLEFSFFVLGSISIHT